MSLFFPLRSLVSNLPDINSYINDRVYSGIGPPIAAPAPAVPTTALTTPTAITAGQVDAANYANILQWRQTAIPSNPTVDALLREEANRPLISTYVENKTGLKLEGVSTIITVVGLIMVSRWVISKL